MGIPSGRVILSFIVLEALAQLLWWVVGRVGSGIPDIVKGWGFLAVFIVVIFAVAWYLSRLPRPIDLVTADGKRQYTKPNDQKELLDFYERQKDNRKGNFQLRLIGVKPALDGDVPKIIFEMEMTNYLPTVLKLVKVTHSGGNVNASERGSCSLPALPETIDEGIGACTEKTFSIEMAVNGTNVRHFLKPLLSEAGQNLQWTLRGEWYVEAYGKTEVWLYPSYQLMFNQVIAGSSIVDGAVVSQGFEFFSSRDNLRRHHPLAQRIKSSSTIWALWNTGAQAYIDNAIKESTIKHLILPHPRQDLAMTSLALLSGRGSQGIIDDIRNITKEALAKRKEQNEQQSIPIQDRIEVKWYSGIITNTIMVGNPKPLSDESWVQVEPLLSISASERPSFALSYGQTPFKNLFKCLVTAFEDTWSKSKPLSQEDLDWLQPSDKEDSQENK